MGVYFYLVNRTKRERIEYDSMVKRPCIEENPDVQRAFVRYMLEHQGDDCTILNDAAHADDVYDESYTEVNLAEPREFDHESQ